MVSRKSLWVGVGFLIIFLVLSLAVVFKEGILVSYDKYFSNLLRQNMTDNKTLFFKTITRLGDAESVIFIAGSIFLWLWYRGEYGRMLYLFINVGLVAGAINNLVIKLLINRRRPIIEHLVLVTDSSFPSGHTLGSLLCYGTLILFLWQSNIGLTLQVTGSLFMVFLIISVALSRIYVGVHFPTDVIGSIFLGIGWFLVSYPLYETLNSWVKA